MIITSSRGLLTALVLSLALIGCSNGDNDGETPVERGNREQILHMGNGDEPSDVDPHTTTGIPEYFIQKALFEGLVSKHPETLEVVPGVAERWDVSEDNRVFTFHLREDARWSNGDPVTAEDFVWSWERALMPALGNQYAYSLFVVENAEAYHRGEIEDFSEVGVKALDERTLEVTLANPTSYFLQLLDHHSMFPVHRDTVLAHGDMDERGTRWTRPENFVGNGAFTIEEWSPGRVFVVAKTDQYWDADQVELQEIHFHPIQQVTTEERMFRSGQLHVTNTMPTSKISVYREADHPALRLNPYLGTYFYLINTEREPYDDVRVRQALAYSIDRESIVENITQAGERPAYALTPPGTLGYTPEAQVPYDPELARELLAEAGYPGGEGMPKVEILYNTMEDHKKIALAIQQMWRRELNVDVTLRNQEWKVYLNSKRISDFDLARLGWIGDYVDPSTFLDLFITDGGNNNTGWGNEQYDELLRKAARSASREERYDYFQQAESILMEEVPLIPLYNYTTKRLVSPSVKGWYDNIMDYHPYKYLSLEPDTEMPEPPTE
ncbi:peptide ABC transporter substrate-binding protein [Marinimicrobium sp. C2-29]|uniref:peptide ABC transporter substrate-binding protein n=1 Tax=Marinimicrobium sp. C2-29 TaxID=3139825 RepID=UPI003138DB3C